MKIMASGVHATAEAFVALCLRDKGLPSELSLGDTRVLLETVQAAGFKAKSVEPGRLFARRKDGKGTETYLVNANCPFKVIGQDDLDDGPATEWLDRMVFIALDESCSTRSLWIPGKIIDREAIANKIRSEMEECLARQPA